jgi:hypothetical protein
MRRIRGRVRAHFLRPQSEPVSQLVAFPKILGQVKLTATHRRRSYRMTDPGAHPRNRGRRGMTVGVADDVAVLAELGVGIIDRPWRREAAGLINHGAGRWHSAPEKQSAPANRSAR